MRPLLKFIFILLFFQIHNYSSAQSTNHIGLWIVESVAVGDQNMTPVSKWTRINSDGTFQSGNGWLQHSSGTWALDEMSNVFMTSDPLGMKDEYGGFTVTLSENEMYWTRVEDGMDVKVTLVRIQQLPPSPADFLKGIWDLEDITQNQHSFIDDFDAMDKHRLFIRWDRIYSDFSPEGSKTSGYWHIHGHKPEITFLPHQEGAIPESWRIEVNESELIMTGISDHNRAIQRRYLRRNSF